MTYNHTWLYKCVIVFQLNQFLELVSMTNIKTQLLYFYFRGLTFAYCFYFYFYLGVGGEQKTTSPKFILSSASFLSLIKF